MTRKELRTILDAHIKWLAGNGGERADLNEAYLSGADLSDANLRGADLSGADLRCADLRDADLRGADLRYTYLRGANLSGADLSGADLLGASIACIKIRCAALFNGIYKYPAMPIIAEDGTQWIKLGCFTRSVGDWEADFWNNPEEFPNDGDSASKDRWSAYQTCLAWLKNQS